MASKDLFEKDLYAILGVKKSDSPDAIKKQYRKLARELHPDKTKGDKRLEERFKDVSEAYEVLSDDKKKAEYDEMRDAYKTGRMPRGGFQGGPQGGGFPGGFQSGGDFSDIFGDLFGGGGRRGPRKGQDLQTQTTISFRDSIYGCEITIRTGSEPFSTRIPAGIKDGAKIKLKGRGAPGEGGPGDLFVIVNVTPHPLFKREENNLLMTLPVTFTEAALGADIPVPTMSGEEVKVRFRPDFFPFVEPGVDYAISSPKLFGGRWVELGGAGLIHPNILERYGIDTQRYSGFAFGLGVERIPMMATGVDDLRLFLENDARFLNQFRRELL